MKPFLTVIFLLVFVGGDLAYGHTPLHWAAEGGDIKRVEALLKDGANVNARDPTGSTPLHWAIEAGRNEIVTLLLKRGAKWDIPGKDGVMALGLAILKGHTAIVQTLLAAGTDVNSQDEKRVRVTGLCMIARTGRTAKIAQALLAAGVDPNARCKEGLTALHFAARAGHIQIVRALLVAGADPNAQDDEGYTPLHWGGGGGSISIQEWQLMGESALEGAATVELIKALLAAGADPLLENNAGGTAYQTAESRAYGTGIYSDEGQSPRHKEILGLLAAKSFSNAVEFAVQDVELLRYVLKYGADVNAGSGIALLRAAKKGTCQGDDRDDEMNTILRILLAAGADVNARDRSGKTALHLATYYRCYDKVRALLAAGADVNARDRSGKTALDWAIEGGRNKIIPLLKTATATRWYNSVHGVQ